MRTRRLVLLLTAVFLLGVTVSRLPATLSAMNPRAEWDRGLEEVHDLIAQRYVKTPKDEELYKAAIKGMVQSLDDRFTEFVEPDESAAFEKEITGSFVGIGATIGIEDGVLTIISPLEDSPALGAGIAPGDQILQIDAQSTKGITTSEAVKRLTGPEGTTVRLLIGRHGKELPVTIVRQPIVARVVHGLYYDQTKGRWAMGIDPARGILYVRLSQFTPTAAEELHAALLAGVAQLGVDESAVRGLILDLRDNPGGVLEQATEIADLFLDDGVIVSTRGRAHREKIARAQRGQILPGAQIAVLVNAGSASASEIVSGALSDNKRAIIVGVRTYGKGVVQSLEELRTVPDAILKLTEQYYYLPSGRLIQRVPDEPRWGVDPTDGFAVTVTDAQRRENLKLRRVSDAVRLPGGEPVTASPYRFEDPAWIRDEFHDPQLAAALSAVQVRLDSGDWKPTGEPLPRDETTLKGTSKELDNLERLRDRYEEELVRVEKKISALTGGQPAPSKKPDTLWADSVDPTGGSIEVRSADGSVLCRLKITGADVEYWLLQADIEAQPAGTPAPPAPVEPTPGQ